MNRKIKQKIIITLKTFKKIGNNFKLLFLIYACSIFLAATIMFYIENSKTFLDWVYFSIISSLSIGYGDITPQTNEGKIIISIFGIIWLLGIVPLFLTQYITKTIKNIDLFSNKEQIFLLQGIKDIKKILKELKEENILLKEEIEILKK